MIDHIGTSNESSIRENTLSVYIRQVIVFFRYFNIRRFKPHGQIEMKYLKMLDFDTILEQKYESSLAKDKHNPKRFFANVNSKQTVNHNVYKLLESNGHIQMKNQLKI
ncbi:hypothetical protein BpHYR1_022584 [Brachionus plicatilis]|uniref:Uncharacterized protein n=1 Tax=Brachionus plicatilis TaxID=10195 RepID=A0A3M7T7Q1_BRAPC|nr:hypothetical protein BpHYR1_022584 [Brachionus plicatilis]